MRSAMQELVLTAKLKQLEVMKERQLPSGQKPAIICQKSANCLAVTFIVLLQLP